MTSRFQAWIFDMDGTLTISSHDFSAFKKRNGLPSHQGILESAGHLPEAKRALLMKKVEDWEWEHAHAAKASVGAVDWLSRLKAPRAILTRNTKPIALATLKAAGLDHFFEEHLVFGRDEATAKPSPAGVLGLCELLRVPPKRAVMIGDHDDDITAGLQAASHTIGVGPRPLLHAHEKVDRLALIKMN